MRVSDLQYFSINEHEKKRFYPKNIPKVIILLNRYQNLATYLVMDCNVHIPHVFLAQFSQLSPFILGFDLGLKSSPSPVSDYIGPAHFDPIKISFIFTLN